MEIKYFTELDNGFNAYDLKQEFKRLSLQFHPDKGGQTADFQAILSEYEYLSNNIGINLHLDSALFESETIIDFELFLAQIDSDLLEMYNKLKYVTCDFSLEICGDWLWLTTDKSNANIFNKKSGLGFSWSPNKKSWYWKPYKFKKYNKKSVSMGDIRTKYGSYSPKKLERLTA